MRNLAEEDGYGVVGEPIDLGPMGTPVPDHLLVEDLHEGTPVPDHLLAERLPAWSLGQWALCAIACLVVVGLCLLVLGLMGAFDVMGILPVAGSR